VSGLVAQASAPLNWRSSVNLQLNTRPPPPASPPPRLRAPRSAAPPAARQLRQRLAGGRRRRPHTWPAQQIGAFCPAVICRCCFGFRFAPALALLVVVVRGGGGRAGWLAGQPAGREQRSFYVSLFALTLPQARTAAPAAATITVPSAPPQVAQAEPEYQCGRPRGTSARENGASGDRRRPRHAGRLPGIRRPHSSRLWPRFVFISLRP